MPPGRKKINCELGTKKCYSFWLYPVEFERLNIEYQKIKRDRPKYYIKEDKK